MWAEITRHLPDFDSAVLTGLDVNGHPASVRCHPRLKPASQSLLLEIQLQMGFQPGKACLLFHKHDERLWNLKSFIIQGSLECRDGIWELRPQRFIPGMGIGGWVSFLRFVIDGRRKAKRYLAKRGWGDPHVPWDEIAELMAGDSH